MATLTGRVFQHERLLVAAALGAVTALAWGWLLAGAGLEDATMGMDMAMPMSPATWNAGHAAVVFGMWMAMMAAMMLPSAAPMILMFDSLSRRRHAGLAAATLTGMFLLAYAVVWSGFSLAAAGLQYALEQLRLLSPMMETTSIALAGSLFVAAGLYQWLPVKQACLRRCRSPLEFVLTQWRDGRLGAFRMGLAHGAYCVGCCWALMLLLFVGGVMNLAWVGAIAAFVLVEKLAPGGPWLGRLAGLAVAGWGLVLLSTLR